MAGKGFLTPGLLFLNSGVSSEFRFMKLVFAAALASGKYSRFVEPAAGAMAYCHMARQAGWYGAVMEASDVVLFSNVMGSALMGNRVEHLDVRIDGFDHEDLGDPATVIWAEAVCRAEAKGDKLYWQEIARSMLMNRDAHIQSLNEQLEKGRKSLDGISYRGMDLFDHLDEVVSDPRTLVALNPPSTKQGYEKFYDTKGRVQWNEPVYQIFDPAAGYERLRRYMENSTALLAIHEENQGGFEVDGAVVARGSMRKGPKDLGISRSINYYVVSNRPDEMEQYVGGKLVIPWPGYKIEKPSLPILAETHPVTEATKCDVVHISSEQAYYLRSLWTHKFVGSSAVNNLALILDGYIAGVYGYDPAYISSSGMYGKDSDAVLVVYGMTVPQRRFRFNRLLSRLALSRRSLQMTLSDLQMSKVGTLVTSQMSPHPESKEYRGIMKLLTRKKDPLHGYRLTYTAPVDNSDWPEIYAVWLKDEYRWQKARKTDSG